MTKDTRKNVSKKDVTKDTTKDVTKDTRKDATIDAQCVMRKKEFLLCSCESAIPGATL